MAGYDDCYPDAEKAQVSGTLVGETVLFHGEILIPGTSKLRRRTQHIVLTDQHIVIFKNQRKAAEVFPSISGLVDEDASSPSTISPPSQLSGHSFSFGIGGHIHLDQVIGAHKLDEERTDGTILEISYLQGDTEKPTHLHFQYTSSEECNVWLSKIRDAFKARSPSLRPLPHDHRIIPSLILKVEAKLDYDPTAFDVFRVVQHVPFSTQTGQVEEARKSPSKIYYLVVGAHNVHLIPMENQPSSHWSDMDLAFGILTLTSLPVVLEDVILRMTFRYV